MSLAQALPPIKARREQCGITISTSHVFDPLH
jgi:hypothetical protein